MSEAPPTALGPQELRRLEAEAIASVSGAQLMAYTRGVARWVRLSGEMDERRAFEYVEGVLRELGVRTRLIEHDAFISLPGRARLEIVAPRREELPCITHAFAAPTGPQGIEGELVDVGAGTAEAYARAAGKIALLEGLGIGGRVRRGEEHGAIAQIFIHGEYAHETSVSPLWGAPTPETAHLLPKTPSFSVNRAVGTRLRELLRGGAVRLRLWGEVTTGWRTIPLLVGDLPGELEPDRFVLLSSHLDAWHYGAMDNGSANATLLEALRVLAGRMRRRGLRVAFWSGHSHGRFAGSAWYADHFWFDLYQHCVAHVNADSTGGRGATVLEEAPVMAELRALAAEFIRTIGGQELRGRRIGRFADQSFVGVGVPSIFGTFSEQDAADPESRRGLSFLSHGGGRAAGLGWWWHTPEDTVDKVDEAFLVRDTRIYVGVIFRLVNEPILPLDYRATAREFREQLTHYQEAARGALDLGAEIAAAAALEARTEQLAALLADETVAADPRRRRAVNDTLLRLGRLLVPVGYTIEGPFGQDLGVALPAIPGLARAEALGAMDPASSEARMLYTGLRRQANRVRFALEEAVRAIEAVLAGGSHDG
ncbi:MAG TPA: M28 family peptidase [bacterium]|nr:M28 family peptidase [bacterium]